MDGLCSDGATIRFRLKMTVHRTEDWLLNIPTRGLFEKCLCFVLLLPGPACGAVHAAFSGRKLALHPDGCVGSAGETMDSFSRSFVSPDKSGTKQTERER